MLPAIETAANQRPPFVDRAAALAEINAGALRSSLQNRNGLSRAGRRRSRTVGCDIVALLGMQKQSLAGAAAFDAAVTRYLGCLFGSQLLF